MTNIRPSTAFITIPRANHAQSQYTDTQYKGKGIQASAMLRRDQVQTLKAKGVPMQFDREREQVSQLAAKLADNKQ